jgi:ribosomal subunit interface protein
VKVAIHDRTQDVSPEVKTYVEDKVIGLADHFDLISAAEVEFDRDLKKRREPLHVVKVTLHLVGHRLRDLRASETGHDQLATFDLLMAKIDGEVTRLKEQVRAHPQRRPDYGRFERLAPALVTPPGHVPAPPASDLQ